MSWHYINPSCFSGEPGDPPEYESDNSVDCASCHRRIDLDDEPHFNADEGGVICEDCRHRCVGCGEFIGDNKSGHEHMILGEPYCRYCAAMELTGGLEAA